VSKEFKNASGLNRNSLTIGNNQAKKRIKGGFLSSKNKKNKKTQQRHGTEWTVYDFMSV